MKSAQIYWQRKSGRRRRRTPKEEEEEDLSSYVWTNLNELAMSCMWLGQLAIVMEMAVAPFFLSMAIVVSRALELYYIYYTRAMETWTTNINNALETGLQYRISWHQEQ